MKGRIEPAPPSTGRRGFLVRAAWALALVASLGSAPPVPAAASAAPTNSDRARAETARRQRWALKRLQQAILLAGPARELEEREERGREVAAGLRAGPPRERPELVPRPAPAPPWRPPAAPLGPEPPPNAILNQRAADITLFATQSEVTLAALGERAVAAWNDGEGGGGLGFAWTSDAGATWTDGGGIPLGDSVGVWLSDPVLAVNEATGEFHLAGIAITRAGRNGIAVASGRFSGTEFAWQRTVVARSVRDTLPDKPWIAADSLTGRVYLTYTSFFRAGGRGTDQVEFQRSLDGNRTWEPARVLSSAGDRGLVQGARPAVGPAGEVWAAWTAVDTTDAGDGIDYLRVRRSDDGGASFAPQTSAAGVFSNFGSGGPGFNRGYGFTWPSIAVDRSRGPTRGRVYLAWNESVNFFRDALGTGLTRPEIEPNGALDEATPFVVGETVTGDLAAPGDVDRFAFSGTQGQTAVFYVDEVDSALDASFQVLCSDGTTRLAFNAPIDVRERFLVFTLPASGTFLLRLGVLSAQGGGYRIRTGWHVPQTERARDQRDVFVTWSDDGRTWGLPVRINDDPGWFDDWLPEIAVAADGTLHAQWFDWRDGSAESCGGTSHVYLSRSEDGGRTWVRRGPITETPTPWSVVSSNLTPNQGDYLALFADDRAVWPCWADGRYGDPDAFAARIPSPGRVWLDHAQAEPGRVRLVWSAPSAAGVVATVYRSGDGSTWIALGDASSDAYGRIVWTDSTVVAGRLYRYRLGLHDPGAERFAAETSIVAAGLPAGLALESLRPNPATSALIVTFALYEPGAATIELLDLGGRKWTARPAGDRPGRREIDLGAGLRVPPGIYWVRLVQGKRTAAARVAFVR